MSLNKKDIKQIKKLREKGKTIQLIADKFNISTSTVSYHVSENENKKAKIRANRYYQKLTPEEKKLNNKKYTEYRKNYYHKRYNEDEEFRLRMIGYVKKSKEKRVSQNKNYATEQVNLLRKEKE